MIKAIIFDFDGVIAESVNVKTEAFASLYEPYGNEVVKKVIKHHLANGGVSRFEKFKIYHKNFLDVKLNDKSLQKLSDDFSNLVVDKVIKAPYVPGVLEFIKLKKNKYDLYISSATPQGEICQIVKQRGILDLFKEVYGSPVSKGEHVKRIMKAHKYKENEVVFIGDSTSDRDAAYDNRIRFIARIENEKSPLYNEINKTVDFFNLEYLVKSLN